MRKILFLLITFFLVCMAVFIASPPASAQSALSAVTNTAPIGKVLTLGAHTRVFTSPTRPFYNGIATFAYNRTMTGAIIDTIYITDGDSTHVVIDSLAVIQISRENTSWAKLDAARSFSWPTITFLPNPCQYDRKTNWLSISWPVADTSTAKLTIIKPFGRR